MIRLFAGIELPPAVKQLLALMCGGLPGARWTSLENFHLTLAFIGEVDENVGEEIDAVLETIADTAFDMALEGVGQFDRGGHTKIVWAGIATNPALMHLEEKAAANLVRAGLLAEHRKFTPHVTLARMGHGTQQERVLRYLEDHAGFETDPFPVPAFTLFESMRGNGQPHYRPLKQYPLGKI